MHRYRFPPQETELRGGEDVHAVGGAKLGHVEDISIRDGWVTLATPESIKVWSLTSLKEKLIKIGAKVVSHGRYVAFQMAEVAIPRNLLADILRLIAELRPPQGPPSFLAFASSTSCLRRHPPLRLRV